MKARRLPQGSIVLEVLENMQEIIWSNIVSGVKGCIKTFIENLLENEITAALRADRSKRNSKRKGYRNGHYQRSLLTKYGLIEEIHVPRMNKGGMEFSVFDRYEHRRRDIDAAFGRLFLNGVSTRKLKGINKDLWGKEISPQRVSSTFSQLDTGRDRFKDKPIDDTV